MRTWKALLLSLLASTLCFAQQPDRIAGAIASSQTVALAGQVNHRAKPQYDQGPVEASFKLNQITLLTLPTPSQQKALSLLVAEQQNPKSPNYHKWLTPETYADRFGLSQNDVQKISAWLQSQGLTVVSVARGRNWMVFSGTAGQIESAFRTELHYYKVDGKMHFANSTPPSIPAALAGIVQGFRGIDDFRPKAMYVKRTAPQAQKARPNYYDSEFNPPDFVAPGDIATIYDINPLYNASPAIDGTGQKLVIVGQTDIYLADLNAFRTGFGLPLISGCTTDSTTTQITACNSSNFVYVLDGSDPGVATPEEGDLAEADLDLEWSAATARGAQIIFVNSTDVFTSYYYAIDNDLAPVISMSYGAPCEFADNSLPADEVELTKSNALGITFMNSSGDSGAASCDPPPDSSNNLAVQGLAVSYPASSPEVTGVGGTAIEYPNGFTSTYWGTGSGSTTNGGTAQNAPLPEIAWNDDVELTLLPGTQYDSALLWQENYAIVSSGGGASNCSVQSDDFSDCASGFPQPSWQTVTISGQNTRLVPDVSLLASPNFPGFVYCTPIEELSTSSPYDTETTSSCGTGTASEIATAVNGVPNSNPDDPPFVNPSVIGGTSASSPIFAGIVALLNQYLGSNGLGNINPTLYTLAASTPNAFHQVTSGTNVVYCEAGTPAQPWPTALVCPSGTNPSFGYNAADSDPPTGYNLVTGLGSVDANALFTAWAASRTGSSVTISPSATNVNQGTSVTFTATVTPSTGVGTVSFSTLNNGSLTVLGSATLNVPYPPSTSGTATFTTTALPGGSNSVTATYEGDASNGSSTSLPATVTVTVPFTMSATPALISVPAGQTATYTINVTPASGFTGTVSFTNSTASNPGSCTQGLPAGALCSFGQGGSVTLNGTSSSQIALTITTAANMALPTGAQAITVTGTSGTATGTAVVDLNVTATNQSFTLSSTNGATFSVAVGGTGAVQVAVAGTNGFIVGTAPSTTTALPLTYTCTGSPALAAAEIQCELPNGGQPTNATAVTVNLVTTAPTTQLRPPLGRSPIFYALLLPGLFGVVFVAGSRQRGVRMLSLIMVLGLSTLWLGSCSSGGGNSTTPTNPGSTVGTYTVTISATTGGAMPLTNANPPFTITLNVTAQ
jgi:subtilase family serine protease